MKKKTSVLIFDAKPYDREFFDAANERYGFQLHYLAPRLNRETVRLAEGAPAVCVFVNDALDAEVIDKLYQAGVRIIALRCAGYNNVAIDAAHGRIRVVRVPSYSPHAVAEHAAALILTLNRKIHRAWYRTRDANFSLNGLMGFDLYGKTAGIIGTGKIGRILAQILRGFGMRVIAHDPRPDPEAARTIGFEYLPLELLYRQSDILSLHCPLTLQTLYMINKQTIAMMKDGVMIINTGRGKLIRTTDLIWGLKNRKIGAAGLDVYEEEEAYFFEDYSIGGVEDDVLARLMTFPNVLVTAHQAFFTREAMQAIAQTTLENLRAFFAGEPLVHEVLPATAEAPTGSKP